MWTVLPIKCVFSIHCNLVSMLVIGNLAFLLVTLVIKIYLEVFWIDYFALEGIFHSQFKVDS